MKSKFNRNEDGMALLVAAIFLILVGLLAVWITARVMDNTRHVEKYVDYRDAFEGVQTAESEAWAEINNGGDGRVGIAANYNWANGVPGFSNAAVTAETMSTEPNVQYFAYTLNWANDGIDNNGDGATDSGAELNGYQSTYAFARVFHNNNETAYRATETVMQGVNVNIWQNAIFAGTGQAGGLINGNVEIHGSVHLLGDNLGAGGVAISALDLSGTSLIHNNYTGITADLAGRVPALGTTTVGGETVQTLNAKLRVKNGQVGLSGNSEIGEVNVTGNSTKEYMDGVYVSDGWTGNQGSNQVFSDNGTSEGYDLADLVDFPNYTNDAGVNHLNYYTTTSGSATSGLNYIYQGDLTIKPSGGNFYWDATTNTKVVNKPLGSNGMPTVAQLNSDHFYVWFDDATDTMRINGRIPVNGNINLTSGSGAGNKLINYLGKGSMLAYNPSNSSGGDVTIDASLKTTSYPGTNLLGVQAQDQMSIGTSSQLEIMGGFYAQNNIVVNKQTTIMGTIVGNYFDMGGQVPKIFQVPALANSWTSNMRMIGANPVLVQLPLSWRELAIL